MVVFDFLKSCIGFVQDGESCLWVLTTWLLVPGVGSVKALQGYQRDFPHEDQAPVPALQAAAQTQARYRTAV